MSKDYKSGMSEDSTSVIRLLVKTGGCHNAEVHGSDPTPLPGMLYLLGR